MVEHEPGCTTRHTRRQRCDTPRTSVPVESVGAAEPSGAGSRQDSSVELFIDRGSVGSCLIALPILLPFIVFIVAFSGDRGGDNLGSVLLLTLVAMTGAFLAATYTLLTVIDWIGKHI